MTKVNTPTEDNDEYTSNNTVHLEKVSNIYFYLLCLKILFSEQKNEQQKKSSGETIAQLQIKFIEDKIKQQKELHDAQMSVVEAMKEQLTKRNSGKYLDML